MIKVTEICDTGEPTLMTLTKCSGQESSIQDNYKNKDRGNGSRTIQQEVTINLFVSQLVTFNSD
jgi:hypothetical protein